jgi:hypothetical protein
MLVEIVVALLEVDRVVVGGEGWEPVNRSHMDQMSRPLAERLLYLVVSRYDVM